MLKSKWLKSLFAVPLVFGLSAPLVFGADSNATDLNQVEESTEENNKVIIDADMGQLNDDAVTMFMLANDENTDVLGVTTVAGNTWAEEGTAYSLSQLELINRSDIPVIHGSEEPLMGNRQPILDAEQHLYGNSEYIGSWSRAQPESYEELEEEPYGGYAETKPLNMTAPDFIIEQIKENPNEVTLFVLGPATNVALAVKKNPEIVPLVKEVIYMGGAIDVPGNTTPAAEFNWWYDPEAIDIVLRTPFEKQIVVPNDIAEEVYYTKEQYDRIVNSGADTPIVQMFEDLHGPRFDNDPDSESYVWDALTAAIFIDPDIATEIEERFIDIDTNYGPNYGRSIGYHESRNRDFDNPEDFPAGSQKVDILFDIDREAFWDLYVDLMTKETNGNGDDGDGNIIIENLEPTEDIFLNAGESVKIEFESDPGLEATFSIRVPLMNSLSAPTELPIIEEEKGRYVGYWTATSNLVAEGAEIEVKVIGDNGNEVREIAEGKLNINVDN